MIEDFIEKLRALPVSDEISEKDRMFNPINGLQRYHSVGRSGLRLILTAALARAGYYGGDKPISTILDFGSAYGRVSRFLKAAFPTARVFATDLNDDALMWSERHLGVTPVRENIGERRFDLIFLGSVFTHTPEEITKNLIVGLGRALKQNGIIVFTTQGRYAYEDIMANPGRASYGLSKAQLDAILSGYRTLGYGFAEYSAGRNYGVAIATPTWFEGQMGNRPDLIQIMFQEKGYDNHQDGYAFMKSDLIDGRRSGI